jgi:hypothetical protein
MGEIGLLIDSSTGIGSAPLPTPSERFYASVPVAPQSAPRLSSKSGSGIGFGLKECSSSSSLCIYGRTGFLFYDFAETAKTDNSPTMMFQLGIDFAIPSE